MHKFSYKVNQIMSHNKFLEEFSFLVFLSVFRSYLHILFFDADG
ncbi:hypothetical protein LEP1GSC081_2114 [Leptospira kirschneri str. H1]|uniref:Uncharacterized protein n=1 Tax=Leptospira kirschneri str. H1 TaxID=1049966 RepID=A0A0E2AWW6_9LEPT|nr:hypothetical protein LEP1GSC081_2114 [Leptospira kirschneri str. H1]